MTRTIVTIIIFFNISSVLSTRLTIIEATRELKGTKLAPKKIFPVLLAR